MHHQGRLDRRRADGRSQRLDPDAAAGALPPMFGAFGRARTGSSVTFVSEGRLARARAQARHRKKRWSRSRTRAAASARRA
jgi:urease alpha subunit